MDSKVAKEVHDTTLPILNFGVGKSNIMGQIGNSQSLSRALAMNNRHCSVENFLTITPNDVSNPRSFRMCLPATGNQVFPAVATEKDLEDLRQGNTMTVQVDHFKDGETTRSEHRKIKCDCSARVDAANGNPVAVALEHQTLMENIMSELTGCKLDFRHTSNGSTKRTTHFKARGKGIFGHVTGFFGMTETQARGALHFHVLIFGGLTPKLLEQSAGCKELSDPVANALDSMFTAELPRGHHVRDLLVKEMKKQKRTGRVQNSCKPPIPNAMVVPPLPSAEDKNPWQCCVCESVLQTGIHSHCNSCKQPPAGAKRCRGAKPSGLQEVTGPVQLVEPEEMVNGLVPEVQDEVDPFAARSACNCSEEPVPLPDNRVVVWELKRPLLEPLPELSNNAAAASLEELGCAEASKLAKDECIENVDAVLVQGKNPPSMTEQIKSWLKSLSAVQVVELHHSLNSQLPGRNGFVTDSNSTLAAVAGSSTNAILMGNMRQSKNAIFCVAPCVCKNKMALSHCLTALGKVQAEIIEHEQSHNGVSPSKAKDAGTNKRTVQFLFTRVLNTLCSHQEISDTQVALSLLNRLDTEACSDSFDFHGAGHLQNFVFEELRRCVLGGDDSLLGRCNDCHTPTDSTLESALPPSAMINFIPTADSSDLGPAPLFKVPHLEIGDDGEEKMVTRSVPVLHQQNWRFRGEALRNLTACECSALVGLRDKGKTAQDNAKGETRGRKASPSFELDKGHPLHTNKCQHLRSKQPTLIVNGFAPKHPGFKPVEPKVMLDDCERHLKKWRQDADHFAMCCLVNFKPWPDHFSQEQLFDDPDAFSWEALCCWMEQMEKSDRVVDRARVELCLSHMSGFQSKAKCSKMLSAFRHRDTTVWTEEEQAENRRLFSGFDCDSNSHDNGHELAGMEQALNVNSTLRALKGEREHLRHQRKTLQTIFGSGSDAPTSANSNWEPPPVQHELMMDAVEQDVEKKALGTTGIGPQHLQFLTPEEANLPEGCEPCENDTRDIVTQPQSVDDYLAERKLNKEQRQVVDEVRNYFLWSDNPSRSRRKMPRLLVTGDPGSGKSYVVETIVELAARMKAGYVQTTSHNGIAAVNIDGTTLCTLLSVPQHIPSETDCTQSSNSLKLHDAQLKLLRHRLCSDELCLLVLDEVSTIDAVMIAVIDQRLQEVMDCTEPFGGLGVIFVGDFNQLGPVGKMFLLEDMMEWARHQAGMAEQNNTKGPQSKSKRVPKRRRGGGPTDPPVAVSGSELHLNRSRRRKSAATSSKKASFFSRCTVKGLVHRGCKLFSECCRHHLGEQEWSSDPEHTAFLKKLASGKHITLQDLALCKSLNRGHVRNSPEEWQFAPVLVSSNRERAQIELQQARIFAFVHKTCVFKWKNNLTDWVNRPADTTRIFEENPVLWQVFVPSADSFLTANWNTDAGLANGAPLTCHSLSLKKSHPDCSGAALDPWT